MSLLNRKNLRDAVRVLAIGVVVAVVGEWVIDLLRERGFYASPTERLASAISWVEKVMGTPLFHWLAGITVGAAAGERVTEMARRKEKVDLSAQSDLLDLQLPVEERRATLKPRSEEAETSLAAKTNCFQVDYQSALDKIASLEKAGNTAHHADIQKLEAVIAERASTIRALIWELKYDDEYPLMPNLDTAALHSMIPQFDQCTAAVYSAAQKAERILASIINAMALPGDGNTAPFLAAFLQEYVQYPLARATHLLNENKTDPRSALVTFYTRYIVGRRWISQGLLVIAEARTADILLVPEQVAALVDGIPNYRDWWEADRAFFEEFGRLLTIRHLAPVKDAITHRNIVYGFRRDLPDPMRPA